MEVRGAVCVVTGGGGGIGEGLARALAEAGAAAVVVADLDPDAAARVASALPVPARGEGVDAGDEAAVQALVRGVEDEHGRVDLFCANAGIMVAGGLEVPDDDWDRVLRVNVKSHLYAARAVLPGMLERGRGHLLHTASAAGLLTQLGALPYAASKHAVVAVAEWLSITYGDRGIGVSCLCPQAVQTAMTGPQTGSGGTGTAGGDGLLQPADVARAALEGLAEDRFLILPHPQVAAYEQRRAGDRERWLRGMRRAQAALRRS